MSFSSPNFDYETEVCKNLKVPCVPGRPGCVLDGMVTFSGDTKKQIKFAKKTNPDQSIEHKTHA